MTQPHLGSLIASTTVRNKTSNVRIT